MDDDKQAIVLGLGAGLGGFAGLVCTSSFSLHHPSTFDYLVNYWLCLLEYLLWHVS